MLVVIFTVFERKYFFYSCLNNFVTTLVLYMQMNDLTIKCGPHIHSVASVQSAFAAETQSSRHRAEPGPRAPGR